MNVDAHLHASCQVIQQGGILVYPTEGVYGIGCDPRNPDALEKLISVKSRDTGKGLILIGSDFQMFKVFIQPLPKPVLDKLKASWPGPVTWVVPAAENCPDLLTGGRNTIAIRVTDHPFVRALCDQLGHCITSTSANISGEAAITNPDDLYAQFAEKVDYIAPLPLGSQIGPSSVFEALTDKQLR